MFKNYLSYQFAQGFDRACRASEVSAAVKEKLVRSSEKMLDHFAKSLTAKDSTEEAKFFFVSLLCLRDCRDILSESGLVVPEIQSKYDVLHRRLEQLCLSGCKTEKNQLRLLG